MFRQFRKGISTPIAIGIILILAVLVGGFILWQCSVLQKEETLLKTGIEETIEIKIYFHNLEMYNNLSEDICPGDYCPAEMRERYGVNDCEYVFPVTRSVLKPKTEVELIELLFKNLSEGPSEEEQTQGFQSGSLVGMIKDFRIENKIVMVQLNEEEIKKWNERLSPRGFESLSSCEWMSYIATIQHTLRENLAIDQVVITPAPM